MTTYSDAEQVIQKLVFGVYGLVTFGLILRYFLRIYLDKSLPAQLVL